MKIGMAIAAAAALLIAAPAGAQQTRLNSTPVTCASTATQISPPKSRGGITVLNPSTASSTVYIGPSGVTTSTGFALVAGTGMTLQPYQGALYCIVASGTQAVNVVETF